MPGFPEPAMSADRVEHDALALAVRDGALPADLAGHSFFMAPVGTVDTGGTPFPDRPSVINGDGMVYRVDFDGAGAASLTSRIIKPPDYYADDASKPGSAYERYKFDMFGMMRASPRLGSRNFGNTALLPMAFPGDPNARLLACYDAARPVELDPATLRTVTTVGYNMEWQAEALEPLAFPPVLATAHPFFDGHTGELFAVNYGRSLLSILDTIPALWALGNVPKVLEYLVWRFASIFRVSPTLPTFWQTLVRHAQWLVRAVLGALGVDIPSDFVWLVSWDGQGDLVRWKVMLPNGVPVAITDSMHQLAATRDYIVLMDTNFTLRMTQMYNNPFPRSAGVDRLLRESLATQQTNYSNIYIIRRADLVNGQRPLQGSPERFVTATQVRLPLGSVHFLADYANPDGEVTLHVAHGTALDIAEWVRSYDRSPFDGSALPARLEGMIAGGMDVSRVGRYRIRASDGNIRDSKITSDDEITWGIALYAGRGVPAWAEPPERIEQLYWFCSGFWPDLLSDFIYKLYAVYPNRLASLDSVQTLPSQGGRPSTLFRLDTAAMTIADCYVFDEGVTLSSPQFVPRAGGTPSQTDGYIVCTVWTQTDNELWIFAADNLARGPLCKLGADDLSFGFSMHSAWMPSVAPRTASYNVDVRRDYGPKIAGNAELEALFETYVYPHFPP